jgi:predicted PurR-regulated permease PerM
MRLPRHRGSDDRAGSGSASEAPAQQLGEDELAELATTFAPPRWLRDLGFASWLLVGFLGVLAGIIWLLGATETIGGPVVAATIVGTVAMPIIGFLHRHRVPRPVGAVLVLLAIVALGLLVVVIVIGGITGQTDAIATHAGEAADKAEGWLKSVGVDQSGASAARSSVTKAVPATISTLTKGVVSGIRGVSSILFALSFTFLSLFFVLKDGPSMRRWVDGHLGVPYAVGRVITGGLITSLRGYFLGVTLVAAFNGVVVTLGALLLDVPLAGTIGVVTLVTAYIPYIGAFVAGAFAVVIALGAKGTTTALIMLVIVILANGLLQNIVQPFAMGSALNLHPLAVLVLTIGAGCVFGMFGLVLAAPLTSAAVHITRDLARARARLAADAEAPGPDESPPPGETGPATAPA